MHTSSSESSALLHLVRRPAAARADVLSTAEPSRARGAVSTSATAEARVESAVEAVAMLSRWAFWSLAKSSVALCLGMDSGLEPGGRGIPGAGVSAGDGARGNAKGAGKGGGGGGGGGGNPSCIHQERGGLGMRHAPMLSVSCMTWRMASCTSQAPRSVLRCLR